MAARRTLLSYISTGTVFISLALAYIKFLDTKVDAISLIMVGIALVYLKVRMQNKKVKNLLFCFYFVRDKTIDLIIILVYNIKSKREVEKNENK